MCIATWSSLRRATTRRCGDVAAIEMTIKRADLAFIGFAGEIPGDQPATQGAGAGVRPRMRHALPRAYRMTCYEVEGIEVRIGKRSTAMDGLLSSYGARDAVFLTAYNPYSRVMPAGWNQRMQLRLAEALRRRPVLAGRGSWRRWSEDHLLVFGDARPARRLARRYRQNAIVIVRHRQPARLMIIS